MKTLAAASISMTWSLRSHRPRQRQRQRRPDPAGPGRTLKLISTSTVAAATTPAQLDGGRVAARLSKSMPMSSFAPTQAVTGTGVDAVLITTAAPDVPTDDVGALRDALRAALDTSRQVTTPTPDPRWRGRWPVLAELGLPAFCVPEALDGFGLRADVAAAAATELGAALH
ncbi:hypothetical protein MXD58_010420, partial [Frankia sp. AgKG'84/4]|nr:hypothetical protein [Frankia sp. AgKG'84/4]